MKKYEAGEELGIILSSILQTFNLKLEKYEGKYKGNMKKYEGVLLFQHVMYVWFELSISKEAFRPPPI